MNGTFNFTKLLDYGTENYIVARLSLQIFQILKHCKIDEGKSDEIKSIYVDKLMPQLIHCWKIEDNYRKRLYEQVQNYEALMKSGRRGVSCLLFHNLNKNPIILVVYQFENVAKNSW